MGTAGYGVYNSALDLIGGTPMVRINRVVPERGATIFAKLESYNIGGSVKDRICKYMVEEAERNGKLKKNMAILEATSGNTGIGLAIVATLKGYKAVFVMPDNVSPERRKLLQAYGSDLILTPGEKGTAGAIEVAYRMAKEEPWKYFLPDQFGNPANVLAHYETTGKEILEQTGGKLDMLVVGIGTSGTAMGAGKRVKEHNPKIVVVGVEPILGQRIQGLRNMREPFPPSIFNSKALDERVYATESDSITTCRELARKEGLLMGISSGAVMAVALAKSKTLGEGKIIVAVLPDTGERYLSTEVYGQLYSPSGITPAFEHELSTSVP